MKRTTVIAALVTATIAVAGPKPPTVYGPAPDWQRFQDLGVAAVRAKLPSGYLFSVEWPNGYMKAGWRHGGAATGYLSCGVLRSLQPVPKFRTLTQFAIVIDNDRVQTIDISTRESNSLVNVVCDRLVAEGRLPPARFMPQQLEAVTIAPLGLVIRPMAEGAYVVSVDPDGPAAKVGVAPGTVITEANGIALAAMGRAMTAVLASDVPLLAIKTAAGQRIQLHR